MTEVEIKGILGSLIQNPFSVNSTFLGTNPVSRLIKNFGNLSVKVILDFFLIKHIYFLSRRDDYSKYLYFSVGVKLINFFNFASTKYSKLHSFIILGFSETSY